MASGLSPEQFVSYPLTLAYQEGAKAQRYLADPSEVPMPLQMSLKILGPDAPFGLTELMDSWNEGVSSVQN